MADRMDRICTGSCTCTGCCTCTCAVRSTGANRTFHAIRGDLGEGYAETYLPAEEDSPRAQARLSRQDVHQGRHPRAEGAPEPRTPEAHARLICG